MSSEPLSIHVIGCGLIGTSIALALQEAGYRVSVQDINPEHVKQAENMGIEATQGASIDLVFVCVPPSAAASTLNDSFARFPGALFLDVSSVRGSILDSLESSLCESGRVMGAHPMAGREVSGPGAARA